jgi:hypothetical protein
MQDDEGRQWFASDSSCWPAIAMPPSVAMVRDRRADEARLPVPRGNAVAHARVDVGASVLILL